MKYRLFYCIAWMICSFAIAQAQESVTVDTVSRPALGGEWMFPVESVTKEIWQVEAMGSPDWMTVEKKDSTGFLVTMKPNKSGADRKVSVRIFSKNKELIIPLLQVWDERVKAKFLYNHTQQYQWLGAPTEWGNTWTVSVNPEANSWAHIVRHGSDMMMLYLTENTERKKRTLRVTMQDGENELAVFEVDQWADPLPLSRREYSLEDGASVVALNVGVPDSLNFQLPDWVSIRSKQKAGDGFLYEFAVQANLTDTARYDSIRIRTENNIGYAEIPVSQYGHSLYTPIGVETLCDIPVTVARGNASSFQPREDIEFSFDGDPATIYHSSWDNTASDYLPVTLTYAFQHPETVDYLEYYPRLDGGVNGLFKEVDILVQTAGNQDYRLLKSVDFKGRALMTRVDFPETQHDVTSVRLIVKSGAGIGCGFASCSEMKFYRKADVDFRYTDLFTDSACSVLKPGVTERKIKRCRQPFFRNLAMHMLQGNYSKEFRIQSYRAWMVPDVQAKQNGVMPFSLLDNPTGIAAVADEPLVVFVDRDLAGLSLTIQNLSVKSGDDGYGGMTYTLHKGLNVIRPVSSGLGYVIYQSETPEAEPPVTIHFATGLVNGYYDAAKHIRPDGTSRWNELLARAGDKYFDVLSPYVHFTFRAEDFRRYVPDVNKLQAVYDTLVCHEQEFEGLRKYNRWMKNRLYIHTTYREMLYATHYHIGFQEAQLKDLLCADSVKSTFCWGPAHELGHALQVAPGMNWTAMMEVTNNIQSMEMQRLWGNPSRLHTESRSANGFKNIYEQAMNVAFVQQRPFTYLIDWFDQLVPFWQLRLYVMDVCGRSDFYKDVYEASRRINEQGNLTSGQLQLEFVYNSCVASGIDLRPFFDKWGWLMPAHRSYDDYYGKDTIVVTPTDVENLNIRVDALHLPVPAHTAEYITDNTLDLYTHPQAFVSGSVRIDSETGSVIVDGASGAVAFEVFYEGKLAGVSYLSAFKVSALSGADVSKVIVKAVSPDGKRVPCELESNPKE